MAAGRVKVEGPGVSALTTKFTSRSIEVKCSALNVPIALTGENAVVFQASTDARDLALRFFTSDPSDGTTERYKALGPRTVATDIAYLPKCYFFESVALNGTRYPILAMDWVDGEQLDEFVERDPTSPDRSRV